MKNLIIWTVVSAVLGVLAAPFANRFVPACLGLRAPGSIDSTAEALDVVTMYYRALLAETISLDSLLWTLFATSTVVALVMLYFFGKKQARNVQGGVLGDARVIGTTRERRTKNDRWNGRGKLEIAGLVLGATPHEYYFDSSVPHALVVGKTGSGKSQYIVLETLHLLMAVGWNIIATGKSELVELTSEKAEAEGYNVTVIDLNGYPGASGFNPLDLVVRYAEAGNTAAAQQTARQTAADLIPLAGEVNDYFPKAARNTLAAMMLVVAYSDAPREAKNMASVCELIARGTTADGKDPSAPLKDYIRSLGAGHPAFAPASDFLSDGGVTVAGKNVLSTLKEAVSIFADEGLAKVSSTSDISLADIMEQKTIVYVHLLEEGHPYAGLFRVFFNQYWRVSQSVTQTHGGRLPRQTAIVGDEWGNLGRVDCLGELVTLGRSMKFFMYAFVQNLKQLNKYNTAGDGGAGRDKLLGSMGVKVALSLGSLEDSEYFTRLCGKHTVRTQGTSEQRGSGRAGASTSYNETADALIRDWEWQEHIPSRDGSIVVKGGENAKPGREGVFRMPLLPASKTLAASWFGLGTEDEEALKKAERRRVLEESSKHANRTVEVWCPDFEASADAPTKTVEDDEFSAWDGAF